jgi:hypothetical protein
MFDNKRKKLSKQFGSEASVNDTIWGIMNDLTSKNKRNPTNLEKIYLLMGDFVEEEGKDPSPYVQQAMKWKEHNIKQELLKTQKIMGKNSKVAIHTCNDDIVCSACRASAKRTYTCDKFLKEMPIPRNCTNSHGCRCWIV